MQWTADMGLRLETAARVLQTYSRCDWDPSGISAQRNKPHSKPNLQFQTRENQKSIWRFTQLKPSINY
jgi:hypothetical protein